MRNQTYQLVYSTIIVLLFTFSLKGFSQSTITLKMCHDSAEINFPLANQKQKLEQINILKQQNLSSKYLPVLNFKAKASYQSEVVEISVNVPGVVFPEMPKEQYSANIEVNQLIYDGGNIKAAKEVNEMSALIDVQKIDVDIYKIKEQINSLYFSCLLLQENTGILKLTHETILEQKRALKSAVNEGIALASELDNLDAEILRLEQQIIELNSAKNQVLKAIGILACINIDDNTQLTLPRINDNGKNELFRPEHQLFNSQIMLLDASVNLTEKKRMPTLGAFANAGFGKPGYDFFNNEIHGFYMVGAQFQWNIWDWKQTNREKQQILLQKLIIDDNRQVFDKNLSISLSEVQLREQKLEQLIIKDKAIIELQTKISKRTANQMKNGIKTSADYLRDINSEKQARINLESREIQLIQAKIDALTIKGITIYE